MSSIKGTGGITAGVICARHRNYTPRGPRDGSAGLGDRWWIWDSHDWERYFRPTKHRTEVHDPALVRALNGLRSFGEAPEPKGVSK